MFEFFIKGENGAPHQIMIFDVIGEYYWQDSISAKAIVTALASIDENDPVLVRINSNGGDVQDGLVIYNALADRAGDVEIRFEGISASMATVIGTAGDKVLAYETALSMTHKASTAVGGNSKDMRDAADMLDKVDASLAKAYSRKMGVEESSALVLMSESGDKWHTAAEMKELGLVDEVIVPQKFAALLSEDASHVLAEDESAAVVSASLLPSLLLDQVKGVENVVALRLEGNKLEVVTAEKESPQSDADNGAPPESLEVVVTAFKKRPSLVQDGPPSDPVTAERSRIANIMAMAKSSSINLDAGFVQGLIDGGVDETLAGQQILAVKAAISENQNNPAHLSPEALSSEEEEVKAGWANAYQKVNHARN